MAVGSDWRGLCVGFGWLFGLFLMLGVLECDGGGAIEVLGGVSIEDIYFSLFLKRC